MLSPAPWWRSAAIYQVYLRSFADENGDGTGDIAGLRSRLNYLVELGVDAIWINPWYVSPLHDGGYDVADYRDIDPRFGTLEEATELIAEAKKLGLRVLVDLVPNHTSSEHRWFKEALESAPGSDARRRYHFRKGRGAKGEHPPNNWKSVFGGPAWTKLADGDWYLHLFDVTQPDLNWDNDEVREHFDDILRFWLDRGASGFRVDVAHGLIKDPSFPDVAEERESLLVTHDGSGKHPFHDRDELHEIVRRWRRIVDEYEGAMVAEAWVADWTRRSMYVRPDEYHQVFDFDFLVTKWDAQAMRIAIAAGMEGSAMTHSLPTWVLSNHDVVRHSTRYALPGSVEAKHWLLDGDRSLVSSERGQRRARAAALLMLALPGSVYIYQGEELGLPEVYDLPEEVLEDPVWIRSRHTEKGRDGCRVPLPWTVEGSSFGFGSGPSWLPQPADWGQYSVEAQDGVEGSVLELYRAALSIRKQRLMADGVLRWVNGYGRGVVAFVRGDGLRCVVNFGSEAVSLGDREVVLASGPTADGMLQPDDGVWLD
jgi:alpha-glucosidase